MRTRITGATTTVANLRAQGDQAVQPLLAHCGGTSRRSANLRTESDVRDQILRLGKCRWVQPPDAENRTSGGVGGWRGAIPVTPPDFAHEKPVGKPARVCPAWAESSWMKGSQSEPMMATVANRKA